jgi:hypothetical protein
MRRARVFILLTMLTLTGCASGADVTASDLLPLVERDGIPFDGSSIPGEVVDLLAGNKVVLLGETHHLREHWAFVADLLGSAGFWMTTSRAGHSFLSGSHLRSMSGSCRRSAPTTKRSHPKRRSMCAELM